MINEQIQKVAKYICALNPAIDAAAYLEQLNILYGAIYEIGSHGAEYTNELIEIEENRVSHYGPSIAGRIANPSVLMMEYSQIAFFLAQQSHFHQKKYAVAPALRSIVQQLFASELIDEKGKKALRTLVSETELDFGYAAGNHAVSSIRMAPIIRVS